MRTMKLTGQVVALAAVAGLLGLLIWRLTHQSKPPKIVLSIFNTSINAMMSTATTDC